MSIPLYFHVALFALLMASEKWRFTAFFLAIGAVSNILVKDAIDLAILSGTITHQSYWIYGFIDVVTAVLILFPKLTGQKFSELFEGAKLQGSILCTFVLAHLSTSAEYALWQNGYIDTKYLHGYYLQVCFILNMLQLAVGVFGIPDSIRSIYNFVRDMVSGRGLVDICRDSLSKLHERGKDNEGLYW